MGMFRRPVMSQLSIYTSQYVAFSRPICILSASTRAVDLYPCILQKRFPLILTLHRLSSIRGTYFCKWSFCRAARPMVGQGSYDWRPRPPGCRKPVDGTSLWLQHLARRGVLFVGQAFLDYICLIAVVRRAGQVSPRLDWSILTVRNRLGA
ncbi:hypothetical protein P154DRAFT_257815 [Amniculicola lignicola CBS 123094]|uniref:Uncharacterized protein n=1 Tax=Amniculicola lignicola CBS 123094 TaxID=1392246 RepID=A0A6A5WZE1_9PLEO|nr:hypothetical protein P154DRAFT_257815 [Amniculicola lignicola CBS 123094]